MADARVTQIVAETAAQSAPPARVAQATVEAVAVRTPPPPRVAQIVLEAVVPYPIAAAAAAARSWVVWME